MKQKLTSSGNTCYDILLNDEVLLSKRYTACFANFFKFENEKYNKIRIYNIDCLPTIDYKDFYIDYITKMFDLKNTNLTNEYFEFKTTGQKYKDLVVMTIIRLLWEFICGNHEINSIESLFKPLKKGKSKYRNKLKRFCDFYSKINNRYLGDSHCPNPNLIKIKSTEDFKKIKNLKRVNDFFYN